MNNDKILVVIPVVNLWDRYTIHCVESIAASFCNVPFEILIIDNGSTDETVNKAQDFGNRKMPGRMHVISNKENKGVAGAWNQGVGYGMSNGFTHILILNNDTIIGPKTIQAMYDRMKKGGIVMTSAVDVMKEVMAPQLVLNSAHAVNNKPDTEAPHPNFSCFMITPESIEKIGWFDEDFFPAYFEDNDWHYRVKLAGELAIANTTAVFVHYGSRTQNESGSQPIATPSLFNNNASYFSKKWGGTPTNEKFTRPFNDSSMDFKYAKRTTSAG